MAWAPPRNKSNWHDLEEARSAEKSAWRLEPEEETEVPVIVSDAAESTYVDFDGKSHLEQKHATRAQHRVGALSPMPPCLGIGGHTGGSRQTPHAT